MLSDVEEVSKMALEKKRIVGRHRRIPYSESRTGLKP
jgi:hypothetical protein